MDVDTLGQIAVQVPAHADLVRVPARPDADPERARSAHRQNGRRDREAGGRDAGGSMPMAATTLPVNILTRLWVLLRSGRDYSWSASIGNDVRPRASVQVNLTAAQQTTVQNFVAAKLADLKTRDGI